MLYALHEASFYASTPLRLAARAARDFWGSPLNPAAESDLGRRIHAGADLFAERHPPLRQARLAHRHRQGRPGRRARAPDHGLGKPLVQAHPVRPRHEPTCAGPASSALDPAVLIVAPLSGHYATLLRGTVEAFLPDHAVFVTDWINARDVPILRGPLRLPRLHRPHPPDADGPGPAPQRGGRLPAGSAGAGRRRPDGRGRRPVAPGQHDLHGLADRRAPVADGDQQPGRGKALRLVPVEHDLHRAGRPIRAWAGASIRASCSWPASCR
jgi:hypothetical protein